MTISRSSTRERLRVGGSHVGGTTGVPGGSTLRTRAQVCRSSALGEVDGSVVGLGDAVGVAALPTLGCGAQDTSASARASAPVVRFIPGTPAASLAKARFMPSLHLTP